MALALLSPMAVVAQQYFTISGKLLDQQSGESLSGAQITVLEQKNTSARANDYGFYSLSLPQGKYRIKISHLGYTTEEFELDLTQNLNQNFNLKDKNNIQEVVVTAKRKTDKLSQAQMGAEALNMKDVAKMPVIFGEKDIIKTIQLLPGVKSAGEGSTGFSVRGGNIDQNLIVLDEAPVYNAAHLLGFFSTFNSDAIKDATLIKGNAPAYFGGRLSSVLDVKMKEGNNKQYQASGGIGLISSRLTVEGPVQEGKSSFIISGRRTYADLFLKLSDKFKDNTLYFYDLNAKMNYSINDKNKLYLSGYFGQDVLGFGKTFKTFWGNSTATLRWNSIVTDKLFSNTSLIFSNYNYNIQIKNGDTDFKINSHIQDWNFKQDLSYYADPQNEFKLGFQGIHHTITPSIFSGTVENNDPKNARKSLEGGLYYQHNYKASEQFNLDYGLRLSYYRILGGDTYNQYQGDKVSQSITLPNGQSGITYYRLEPRVSMLYRIDDQHNLKAAYARNVQYLHLMSNTTSARPTDQWLGTSYATQPEMADQVALAYNYTTAEKDYEFNVEPYYKKLHNQIDYKDGSDLYRPKDIESQLLYGQGRAYGIELLLKKKTGDLTGWIGYTLSRTERQIDGINQNNWYASRQDRAHDLSVVGIYQLNKKWSLSGTFVYQTGAAVTFPIGKYEVEGQTIYEYSQRNANRMPAYHRLDLGATYEFEKKGRYESSLNLSLYNVYGRQNAYSIDFRNQENNPNRTEIVQTALFRWVPGITYNFKF
jgi:TonB dependent receptor/CarboxypepD_reg-like domain/TonB-dependent Receptor Plug Domain